MESDATPEKNPTLPSKSCISYACFIQSEETNVLQCNSCKRQVHYSCTQLPSYQLQTILDMKTKKYTCSNCVKVSIGLVDFVPRERFRRERYENTRRKLRNSSLQ